MLYLVVIVVVMVEVLYCLSLRFRIYGLSYVVNNLYIMFLNILKKIVSILKSV